MYLIYGKGKVGNSVARLCDFLKIPREMKDDSDTVDYSLYDSIIPSPGVPSHHDVYKTGKVKSELDFAYDYLPEDFTIIAVTGTDGKSTTSWIMYELLRKEFGDESVYLSGNFDIPFSATVKEILEKKQKKGYIVVEVSSFMAYSLERFAPDYSIFTNFKPDHLNWHRDLEDYLDAKIHTMKQTKNICFINEQVIEFAHEYFPEIQIPKNKEIFTREEAIRLDLRGTHFSGEHNAMNILSVIKLANAMGIPMGHSWAHICQIQGLPHRLEKIGEKNGVIFVEDSKSTSSQSLEAALGSYTPVINDKLGIINEQMVSTKPLKNLLLIVGGSDKGDTFDHLAPKFRDRVKATACIGATKELFVSIAKQEDIAHMTTDSLEKAVDFLWKISEPGDVLMLSPGCASFGLFRDYLDRAEKFREAIQKLP